MKNILLAIICVLFVPNLGQAARSAEPAVKVCGQMGYRAVEPVCRDGEACPEFASIQYFITKTDKTEVVVAAKSEATLHKFLNLNGLSVCAIGKMKEPVLVVTAIRRAVSAF